MISFLFYRQQALSATESLSNFKISTNYLDEVLPKTVKLMSSKIVVTDWEGDLSIRASKSALSVLPTVDL